MKQIPLTQGQFALVDDVDFDGLSQFKWQALRGHSGYYAIRTENKPGGIRLGIKMHRQILGLPPGDKRQGDHIDHNTLDNRQTNLRICTNQQNHFNRKSHSNASSKYKGVSWHKQNNKWQADISINGKSKYLGCFQKEKMAALAYDKVALREHGEFAHLNF